MSLSANMTSGSVRLCKFPVCRLRRKQILQEEWWWWWWWKGGGGDRSTAAIEQMTSDHFSPSNRGSCIRPLCGPVQSNLAGGVSKEHNVVKQKSDLLHSPLALAPSLSPLEITLNDICYHQDNLCQLRDETADARPADFETDEGKSIEMEEIRRA